MFRRHVDFLRRIPHIRSAERYTDALYQEARRLGWFTAQDLSLGLEDDVPLAAALNANVSEPPR